MWSISGKTDIANNYERVNAYEGEWTFNVSSKTLTKYNGDLTTVRGEQQKGEVIIPNYYNGTRVSAIEYNLAGVFENNMNLTKVIISSGIKTIGWRTFYNCTNLEKLEIKSNNITTIGSYAFFNCKSLKGDLILPDSITTIGACAFRNDSNLNGILKLPNSIVTIGSTAFSGCTNLKGSIVLPKTLSTLDGGAFGYCSSLEGLAIEEGCTASLNYNGEGIGAFEKCSELRGKIVIPSTFGNINSDSFRECTSLEGIEIKSNNITTIGSYAFFNCKSLKGNLILPDSITSIGSDAFLGCKGLDGIIKMSNKVETIGYRAFDGCSNLKGDLIIPKTVTTLGLGAFKDCSSIESLVIEEGCSASLGDPPELYVGAFNGCTGLKGKVIMPSSFGNIGRWSFRNCNNLEAIEIKNKDSEIYASSDTLPTQAKIIGYENSTAKTYATKYNRTFEAIQ